MSAGTALSREDLGQLSLLRKAELRYTHPLAHAVLYLVTLLLILFVIWAANADLEEVARGIGKVVPSGHTQVIQNLEGGLLARLAVTEGEVVEKDQELCRIADTALSANLGDTEARITAVRAAIARLEAEVEERTPVFPPDLAAAASEVCSNELRLWQTRQRSVEQALESLQASLDAGIRGERAVEATVTRLAAEAEGSKPVFSDSLRALQPVLVKAEEALFEARSKTLRTSLATMRRSLEMAQREVEMNAPLVKEGVVSEIELLRLKRQANEMEGRIVDDENRFRSRAAEELQAAKAELYRQQRQNADLEVRIRERRNQARTESETHLKELSVELARLEEARRSAVDRVNRAVVVSPVRGTVKKIYITTLGGVIRPGEPIMEIVPLDDTLLVEARILPTDVGFVRVGLPATVKITAFDFALYGGLKGKVEHVSADTLTDQRGETFYQIRVRTETTSLGKDGEHQIIPGMVASVDVKTGHRTVLKYLLKPFLRARAEALRER